MSTPRTPASPPLRERRWLVLLVVGATLICDRVTKEIASSILQYEPMRSYFYDTLRLQYVENTGAFLGLGRNLEPTSRFWMFTVLNASLLLLVSFWLWRQEDRGLRTTLGLSLILGGGIGNLLDRMFFDGRVIDFLNVGIGPIRTGIFNVADVAIVAGVLVLLSRLATPRYGSLEADRR